jgi:hypothetical protein
VESVLTPGVGSPCALDSALAGFSDEHPTVNEDDGISKSGLGPT